MYKILACFKTKSSEKKAEMSTAETDELEKRQSEKLLKKLMK